MRRETAPPSSWSVICWWGLQGAVWGTFWGKESWGCGYRLACIPGHSAPHWSPRAAQGTERQAQWQRRQAELRWSLGGAGRETGVLPLPGHPGEGAVTPLGWDTEWARAFEVFLHPWKQLRKRKWSLITTEPWWNVEKRKQLNKRGKIEFNVNHLSSVVVQLVKFYWTSSTCLWYVFCQTL